MIKVAKKAECSFEPSPAEIEALCAEIQRDWSDRERARRAGANDPRHWMPPIVSIREFILEDDSSSQVA